MLSPALFVFLVYIASGVQAVQLPKPKGHFEIGTVSFELTDHSRLDPFAPTPENRSIQVSVHYPTSEESSRLPFATYLPTLTAQSVEKDIGIPAGTLQNISTQAHLNASILDGGQKAPIIFFSPGLGISRLLYTTFVQDLASEGYIVISIDHPRDASIVELSDGRVILFNISDTREAIDLAVSVRTADARFVLDELARGPPAYSAEFAIPGLKAGLGGRPVGFLGHSLGGATAAATMALDKRVVGGVNMDGAFFGSDVQRGVDGPFVILAAQGHNRTTDATWAQVWEEKLLGFKREIEIKETVHGSFTDGPAVTDLLHITANVSFGTIKPQRFEEIQHAYLTAFFDFALKGKKEKLLDGPSPKFPEVSFVP